MDGDIWSGFSPFQSVSFSQRFLAKCYNHHNFEKGEAHSYRNSYPFLYYLQHGKKHYELADSAPVELQPLLLFYGMSQLIKACLLTKDPDYPKTTAVLAHGVSTRKKKKKNYAFSGDEVRIQKHGLTAHFADKLFGMKQLEGKKFTMRELFERIPDLNWLFEDMYGRKIYHPIVFKNNGEAAFPSEILDDLHMTFSRFADFFENRFRIDPNQVEQKTAEIHLNLKEAAPSFPSSFSGEFFIPRFREGYDGLPEVLVHFLLLYNLSMIGRYETEWWSELFHHASSDDLPFIECFLKLTKKKVPLILSRYLRNLM